MDRLAAMQVLVRVVDAGSLSGAARRLGMPLPTVSRRIAELEALLETRLLIRSTRRLTLTDAGSTYVDAARRILEQVGEAERAAAGEYSTPRGELTITAPVAFGRMHVLPVVAAFLDAYPEIDVRLLLADRIANLLEEHIDVSLRIALLPDSNLVASRLGAVRTIVCASPGYLARRGLPESVDDIAAHQCIQFAGLAAESSWLFGDGSYARAVPIHPRLVVTSAEAAIDAAVAGLGLVRVLSYQAAPAVADGKLQVVLAAFEPPPRPVHLVHAGGGPMPLKLRAFLDFARPRLKERLEQLG